MNKQHGVLVCAVALCAGGLAVTARAESFMEQEVSTRLVVNVVVPQAKAQKWLPEPWQVNPLATGPGKGAIVGLTFSDRLAKLDGSGKATTDAAERTVSLQVYGKNPKTGESGNYVFRIYTSNPTSVPGHYRNSVLAAVQYDHASKATGVSAATVSQAWTIRDPKGGEIELQVRYEAGPPTPSRPESKTYGGPDPTFFRIFRVDQGVDTVKGVDVVDRTKEAKLRVTVGDLQELFEDAKVLSIAAAPWYSRQVFLP
jgi:hypothetical protein